MCPAVHLNQHLFKWTETKVFISNWFVDETHSGTNRIYFLPRQPSLTLLSKRYTVMLRVINNADLCFAEWNRGGVGGVSNVQHGGTRWRQGFIDGVEVGPGQPVGQVSLEPLHLLLLLLEEELGSNQTFIGAFILSARRQAEEGGYSWMKPSQSVFDLHWRLLWLYRIKDSDGETQMTWPFCDKHHLCVAQRTRELSWVGDFINPCVCVWCKNIHARISGYVLWGQRWSTGLNHQTKSWTTFVYITAEDF